MAVERRWINWAMAISSALVLIIALAQAVICFYVNLTTQIAVRKYITAAILTSLGVLTFPMTWLGFSATISRHKGVYIAVLVVAGLSFLDIVGMVAWPGFVFSQTADFGAVTGYSDAEGGLSISITVLESLLVFLHFFVIGFAIAAIASRPRGERKPAYAGYAGAGYAGAGYNSYYSTAPPTYPAIASDAYRLSSMPRGEYQMPYYSSGKPRY